MALGGLSQEAPFYNEFNTIKLTAKRASDLTRQLLAFSRKQVMEMKVVDINAIIQDSEKMLIRLLGENIKFNTKLAPDLKNVKIDPGQFDQVLMNLCVNARDAMPKGGFLVLETANWKPDHTYIQTFPEFSPGNYVQLTISDTGCGMTREVKERIFEPFFTTKGLGKGTGLGLSTVFGIIKQSGGYINVYSELDKGTTFKIYLPAVEEPACEISPGSAPAEKLEGSETILFVEDDPMVSMITEKMLKSLGYTVITINDSVETLTICNQMKKPPDLAILDVVMPKLSGPELAESLQKLWPQVKILFISGYTEEMALLANLLEEGSALLQKPYSQKNLGRKVRELLDAK